MSHGTILVTGANGGLGCAIVARILSSPELANYHTGIYTVRDANSASNLEATLNSAPPEHAHKVLDLELTSLAKVRAFAKDINDKVASGELPPIRALILNAGYLDWVDLNFTIDGYEMSWQVNYLANQLLVLLLLQSMDKEQGRILFIGSWTHDVEDKRNEVQQTHFADPKWRTFPGPEPLAKGTWSTPQDDPSRDNSFRRYGFSKLCEVMFMHELATRMGNDPQLSNISVLGIDPGAMSTGLMRRGPWVLSFLSVNTYMPIAAAISSYFYPNGTFRSPSKSAKDVLKLCFDDRLPAKGQALYLNGTDVLETAKMARDVPSRKEVWAHGLEAAGITKNDTILQDWQ